jgi:hypothetical protein
MLDFTDSVYSVRLTVGKHSLAPLHKSNLLGRSLLLPREMFHVEILCKQEYPTAREDLPEALFHPEIRELSIRSTLET